MSSSSDNWFDRKSHKGEIEGTLGLQVSPGVYTFDAGNGYQWFTSETGTVMAVLNAKTAPANIDVIVKMNKSGQYEVIGINTSKVVSALGANAGSVNIPQHTGSTTGPTPELIESRQLEDGLVWQDPNNPIFLLTINPMWYETASGDQAWWPGGTIDVTSYVPTGANTHSWVKVGLDKTIPAPVAVAGTPVAVTVPLTEDDLALITFNGYVPLGGVMLTNGQTDYPVEQDFLDCSNIKDVSGGGGIAGITITDGSTTVTDATEIDFTSGATVVDLGSGVAGVSVSGGSVQYPKRATMWSIDVLSSVSLSWSFNASQAFGNYVDHASPANGQNYTSSCLLQAGTYTVGFLVVLGADSCKFDCYIDGVMVGTTQDLYSAGFAFNTLLTMSSIVVATDGYHKFELIINGKNASSSSYQFRITEIYVQPSAD